VTFFQISHQDHVKAPGKILGKECIFGLHTMFKSVTKSTHEIPRMMLQKFPHNASEQFVVFSLTTVIFNEFVFNLYNYYITTGWYF